MKSIFLLSIFVASTFARSKSLIEVTEDNWKNILKDEWMIEFHAPWCPACKDLQKSWDSFATWSKDLSIKVGEIDVTANPGLSGRFLVTALPTIYHIKDGQFRLYQGPRDKEDFIKFIEDKKWTIIEPLPSWKNPESIQMSIVASFFRASMHVRDLHTNLVEKQGLPPAASYAIFGGATLLLGCVLGFIIVLLIDFVFPASPKGGKSQATQSKDNKKEKKKQDKKKQQEQKKKEKENDHGSQSELSQASSVESADENEVKNRKQEKQSPKKDQKQDKKEESKKKK